MAASSIITEPASLAASTTMIVGFLIFAGYVAKRVLDWFQGNKSLEQTWKTQAITSAIAGHTALKESFDVLRAHVIDLEEDVKQSKLREAEALREHRAEIASLKRVYSAEIETLQLEVRSLRRRLEEYERENDE